MTKPSTDRQSTIAISLVRNVSHTAWQTIGTLGAMIMIGLVGAVWLPFLTTMVNNAAV